MRNHRTGAPAGSGAHKFRLGRFCLFAKHMGSKKREMVKSGRISVPRREKDVERGTLEEGADFGSTKREMLVGSRQRRMRGSGDRRPTPPDK